MTPGLPEKGLVQAAAMVLAAPLSLSEYEPVVAAHELSEKGLAKVVAVVSAVPPPLANRSVYQPARTPFLSVKREAGAAAHELLEQGLVPMVVRAPTVRLLAEWSACQC